MRYFLKHCNKDELSRLARFCTTGVTNTVVDLAVFFSLVRFLEVSVYVAQFLAYCAATLNSYTVNRKWTFRSKSRFGGGELIRFVVLNSCSLGLGLLVLHLLYGRFEFPRIVAKVYTVAFTVPINYLGSHFWVFRKAVEPGKAHENTQ